MVRVVPTSGQEPGRTVHLGARAADGIFGTQTVGATPQEIQGGRNTLARDSYSSFRVGPATCSPKISRCSMGPISREGGPVTARPEQAGLRRPRSGRAPPPVQSRDAVAPGLRVVPRFAAICRHASCKIRGNGGASTTGASSTWPSAWRPRASASSRSFRKRPRAAKSIAHAQRRLSTAEYDRCSLHPQPMVKTFSASGVGVHLLPVPGLERSTPR